MSTAPRYVPADRPTMYFVGVSTGASSIMRIFPRWAEELGVGDSELRGVDLPMHAEAEVYREFVAFLKADPLSLGALVTTHKIDLFHACRDLFEVLDPLAALTGEASSLSKQGDRLAAHAKDLLSSGLTLESFLPTRHWEETGAEVFSMGAGGAAIAITWHLLQAAHGANRPTRLVVSDRSAARLEEIRRVHREMGTGEVRTEYRLVTTAAENDAVCNDLPPGSLVINATGLGKDRPGSPLTDAASFPDRGIAWELNYRGELEFLRQARAQQTARKLQIEDGWTYFIHGWTRVIAEVFHLEIPTTGPRFERLSALAGEPGR